MSYIVPQKMPLRCFECPCCHTIGYFECVSMHKDLRSEHGINISRPEWCPLIEIKTPHGRLIDADAIQDYNVETFGQRLLIIDTAPTIIEAED